MKTETIVSMDYNEFDALVNKHFPNSQFSIVDDQEASNNSSLRFGEIGKDDFLEDIYLVKDEVLNYDLERFFKFVMNDYGLYITPVLLEFFVFMDILPAGNYIIDINW